MATWDAFPFPPTPLCKSYTSETESPIIIRQMMPVGQKVAPQRMFIVDAAFEPQADKPLDLDRPWPASPWMHSWYHFAALRA